MALAIISYFVFLRNIESIAKINRILVPMLIGIIIVVGTINLSKINFNQIGSNIQVDNSLTWFFKAIIYSSYNLILVIPVLINLKKFLKTEKQIKIVSIISAIIIFIIATLTFLLLVNVDSDFSKIEMPVVYVIKNTFSKFNGVYGLIILIAIFSTAISIGVSFLNNVCKKTEHFSKLAMIMCISSIIVSKVGFAKLIQILFPLFGYLGIVQIFFIIACRHN